MLRRGEECRPGSAARILGPIDGATGTPTTIALPASSAVDVPPAPLLRTSSLRAIAGVLPANAVTLKEAGDAYLVRVTGRGTKRSKRVRTVLQRLGMRSWCPMPDSPC